MVNFCSTFGILVAISIREAQPTFNNDLPLFQEEYLSLHPRGVIPVQVNDVFFTIHAVFITAVTICQCFIYEVLNCICLNKKCTQLQNVYENEKPIDCIRAIIRIRLLNTDTQTNTSDW